MTPNPLHGLQVRLSEHAVARRWVYDDWGPFWDWEPDGEPPSWAVYFGFAKRVEEPACYRVGGTLVIHPALWDQTKREFPR